MKHLTAEGSCSQRRACSLVQVWRSTVRYQRRPRPWEETELVAEVRRLAAGHKRYGYRRITALLRREGWRVNRKRVHRMWKAEGLSLPRKRPRRRRWGPKGEVLRKAEHSNHVWSYDFLEDRTEGGGKLRILTVLDEYTRESLAIRVAPSMPAERVIDTLEWLFLVRAVPEHLRSDNGPEFIAEALQVWLQEKRCGTIYIEPGAPWENPYIESFNGKFRDECLNREIFVNGRQAQEVAEAWRHEYNEYRPHSSLGYLTPAEFAGREIAERSRRSGSSSQPTASFRFRNVSKEEVTLSL